MKILLSGWIIKVIVSSLLAEYDNERNKQSILSAMNIIKLTSLFKSIGTIHMYVCVEKVKYLTCLHLFPRCTRYPDVLPSQCRLFNIPGEPCCQQMDCSLNPNPYQPTPGQNVVSPTNAPGIPTLPNNVPLVPNIPQPGKYYIFILLLNFLLFLPINL